MITANIEVEFPCIANPIVVTLTWTEQLLKLSSTNGIWCDRWGVFLCPCGPRCQAPQPTRFLAKEGWIPRHDSTCVEECTSGAASVTKAETGTACGNTEKPNSRSHHDGCSLESSSPLHVTVGDGQAYHLQSIGKTSVVEADGLTLKGDEPDLCGPGAKLELSASGAEVRVVQHTERSFDESYFILDVSVFRELMVRVE